MADITMCSNEDCEQKETCYRYTAKPNPYRQSYFWEDVRKDWRCEYYSNNNKWTT